MKYGTRYWDIAEYGAVAEPTQRQRRQREREVAPRAKCRHCGDYYVQSLRQLHAVACADADGPRVAPERGGGATDPLAYTEFTTYLPAADSTAGGNDPEDELARERACYFVDTDPWTRGLTHAEVEEDAKRPPPPKPRKTVVRKPAAPPKGRASSRASSVSSQSSVVSAHVSSSTPPLSAKKQRAQPPTKRRSPLKVTASPAAISVVTVPAAVEAAPPRDGPVTRSAAAALSAPVLRDGPMTRQMTRMKAAADAAVAAGKRMRK